MNMRVMPTRASIRLTVEAIAVTKAIDGPAARFFLDRIMKNLLQGLSRLGFIKKIAFLEFLTEFGRFQAAMLSLFASTILGWYIDG
jgi:hypothetical protein